MRRRLTAVAAAISLMVAIAFLVPLIVLVRTIAHDRAITEAEHDAALLAPALAVTPDRQSITAATSGIAASRDGRMTVVLPSGDQIGRSIARDDDLELARSGTAFSVAHGGGVAVFTPVVSGAGTSVVRVWVPDSALRKGVNGATASLVGLGILLVLGAIAVADRLGASMVRPIRRLANAAERLGEGDLDQRVQPEGPKEVAAVGHAFNLLAGRVGTLLAAERELVADLSHRLRTPLTVLRFEADAVTDSAERERVRTAADDLETAVTTLIAEARHRPSGGEGGPATDLAAVTQDRVAFWSALAEDQARPFDADIIEGPVLVDARAGELQAALDALLGNVFEHTPDGTPFAVRLRRDVAGSAELLVEDAGPGLADADITRGRSGGQSTGLGLDIARRTAEAAGGSLAIARSELGGASISLTFPSSPH